jgi:predicted outer membrane protein
VEQARQQGDDRGQQLSDDARASFDNLSDDDQVANAAAIVSTINNGELAEASYMLGATTNPEVLSLAAQIQADHQANEIKLHSLLADIGVTPLDNEISATLNDEAMTSLAQLQADDTLDLDVDYVRMQVSMHQEASVLVDSLRDFVDDQDANDFLGNTVDTINDHRDHASDVLDDLTNQ